MAVSNGWVRDSGWVPEFRDPLMKYELDRRYREMIYGTARGSLMAGEDQVTRAGLRYADLLKTVDISKSVHQCAVNKSNPEFLRGRLQFFKDTYPKDFLKTLKDRYGCNEACQLDALKNSKLKE